MTIEETGQLAGEAAIPGKLKIVKIPLKENQYYQGV